MYFIFHILNTHLKLLMYKVINDRLDKCMVCGLRRRVVVEKHTLPVSRVSCIPPSSLQMEPMFRAAH